ncbi:hypothetical protein Pst134EA_015285, partial [Puccinia striiformis f. sp. tritici]|uniref:hypothetical protein n=1 Tax=Puccinia striiformis f. sp. tritici TaxID=168172 RepID=UPI0020072BCF
MSTQAQNESEPKSTAQTSDPKKQKTSWVWQYFKPSTINNVSVNLCQVNKTPGSKNLCLTKIAVDKNQSTKSMINHLGSRLKIFKDKSETGAITKFLQKNKMPKKLDRDSLTAAACRYFIKCNISFNTVEDEDF